MVKRLLTKHDRRVTMTYKVGSEETDEIKHSPTSHSDKLLVKPRCFNAILFGCRNIFCMPVLWLTSLK